LLSASGVTLAQAQVKNRYADPRGLLALLEEHVQQGLLQRTGEVYRPTERGRDVLLGLTEALNQGTASLWSQFRTALPEAVELTRAVIERAVELLPASRYPAFAAECSGYMPAHPLRGFALFTHLATLRYLRADAHALAWSGAGLDATQATCLTELRQATAPVEVEELPGGRDPEARALLATALDRLRGRGWAQGSGGRWRLTAEGLQGRERATNRYNAPPFDAVTEAQRGRLLETLTGLPD
jgi:hypothetical protein